MAQIAKLEIPNAGLISGVKDQMSHRRQQDYL
jgi:hypothetical protein